MPRSLHLVIIGLFFTQCATYVHAQCDQDRYRVLIDGSGTDVAHRVLVHANGDVYVAGYSDSFGDDHDLVLTRSTPSGTMVWSKRYDVVGEDGGRSMYMASGPSGAIYLGGTLNGLATNQEDGSLLKLDENGVVLWARRVLPIAAYCQVRAIAERPDGDIIVVGSANSIGIGNAESYAARFTGSGALVWLTSYGWTGQDHFTHVELLEDGSFLACSQSMGSGSNVRKGYIAHIGDDGDPIGCRLHTGGVEDNYAHGLANADGTYLWVGFTASYGAGARDVLAVLTDDTGGIIWSRVYGTAQNDEGLNAVADPAGGWRIAAFSEASRVAHVLHVLPNGDLEQVQRLSDLAIPSTALWAQVMESAADGGFYLVGSDLSTPAGSIALEKLDACAEASCGSTSATWATFAPSMTQLAPTLPITEYSESVVPVGVTVGEITSALLDDLELVDCDTCSVALNGSGISVCLGQPVRLEPLVSTTDSGVLQWSWDLGDGSLSNVPMAVEHTYEEAGEYTVLLVARDTLSGCSDSLSFNVAVFDVAEPDLGEDVMVCPGRPVTLDPGAPGAATVVWSDGSTGDVLTTQEPGSYWVLFQQGACLRSDTILIDVEVLPELLADTLFVICEGDSVLIEALPGWSDLLWSVGSADLSIWVAESASIGLEATWNGCAVSDTVLVLVTDVPSVDLGPDVVACEGTSVVLSTGSVGMDHVWSDGSTEDQLVVNEAGTIWVVAGPEGCAASDTVSVAFIPPPTVDLGADTLLCDGSAIELGPVGGGTIQWSDGSTDPVRSVSVAGTYAVTVSNEACSVSDEMSVITSITPEVELPSDTNLCALSSIDLVPTTLSGDGILSWSTGDTVPVIRVIGSGTYWLTISNGCGTVTDTIRIGMTAAFTVDLGPDLLLCGDSSVSIRSGHPDAIHLWNTGATTSTVDASASGEYWVMVDINGCVQSDTVVVERSALPEALFPSDTVLCEPGDVLLEVLAPNGALLWSTGETAAAITASAPGRYVVSVTNACGTTRDTVQVTWAPAAVGDSLIRACIGEDVRLMLPDGFEGIQWSSGSTAPMITVQQGEHAWLATDRYGCPRTGRFRVEVDTLQGGALIIPNVFTPNGDGQNDRFGAVVPVDGVFNLTVFNRWGAQLWSTDDGTSSWDWTHDGIAVPEGTYVYIARSGVQCAHDVRTVERTGHLTLLR